MSWTKEEQAAIRESLRGAAGAAWVLEVVRVLARPRPTVEAMVSLWGDAAGHEAPNWWVRPYDARLSSVGVSARESTSPASPVVTRVTVALRDLPVRPDDLIGSLPLQGADWSPLDDGVRYFFHPLNDEGGARAVSVECKVLPDARDPLEDHRHCDAREVSFHFGTVLARGRDGYTLHDA